MVMRALDLFCCAGGAGMGLHRAGFEVVGVDIKPQPNYPFTFIQGDATRPPVDLADFDFIWASPPCQRYTALNHIKKNDHPDLVAPIRELLKASGKLYAIENVAGAPLINPIRLCGTSFGLGITLDGVRYELQRHRYFECNFFALQPPCDHRHDVVGIYGSGEREKIPGKRGFSISPVEHRREIMQMPWAGRHEIAEAIPPAYSEYIAREAMKILRHG